METKKNKSSPEQLVSKDDGGLWMKMDPKPVADNTASPLVTCGEKPRGETKVIPPAPAVISRYVAVMDDEGTDDVFIPPPPPYMAPSLPAEGSTDTMANNSSLTLTNEAADATEAKDNPSGLDWHPGEEQLMAAQTEEDEVVASIAQTSKESMNIVSLSKDEDSKDQDQTFMEDTCHDPSGRHHRDSTTGDEELVEEAEHITTLREGQEKWRETEGEKEKYPKEVSSSIEENSDNETHFDKEGDGLKSKDICGLSETDSKLSTENVDCGDVETNAPKLSCLRVSDDDFESRQNTMDAATYQPQVPDILTDVFNDEERVDTRSLNYTLTKDNLVESESSMGETQVSPISEGLEEMETNEEQEDGSRRIATDIQQGEQLLQRLQLVQLRQDVCTPGSPHTSQQVVQEKEGETKGVLGNEVEDLKAREADPSGGDETDENRFLTVEDKEAKTNLMEKETIEKNESKDIITKARKSSSTMLVESEHHAIAGDSNDDQRDSWVPGDTSPIDPNETSSTQITFLSSCHQISVAETSTERQTHKEDKGKHNLLRAGGICNLADNPDVLEIPFKTNILLEPLESTKDGPDQRSDWQFSEQKMKREISQEFQRELVLVNQGKIPGGYSKGEVRQLKETKLLFEAFQQDNTEGPTRHRKPPTSQMKGRVYPSVLERTRSMEMLSLKSCPVSRAHSLKMYKETEKSPEILRSMSPTGGFLDKTRVRPYAKQDKLARMYRSMDHINTEASSSSVGARSNTREGNAKQESPILKQNPFFKLRPALALQPEVEKDIREAREREEDLRRQRCTLYGENRLSNEDGDKSRPMLAPDVRKQSRGKLERVWPPPSKKDQMKSEQTQQEPQVHRAGGQKAPLWQRWESGLINGKPSKEKN